MNWQWYPGAEVLQSVSAAFSLRGAGRMLLGFAKLQRQKTSLKNDVATKLFHLYHECVLSEEDLQLKIKPLTGRNSPSREGAPEKPRMRPKNMNSEHNTSGSSLGALNFPIVLFHGPSHWSPHLSPEATTRYLEYDLTSMLLPLQ